jgi:transposase
MLERWGTQTHFPTAKVVLGGAATTRTKCLIVAEATQPGATVVEVARRWGIGTGLIYIWRRQMRQGELDVMPVAAFAELTVTPSRAMAEPEPVAAPPEMPAEASAHDPKRIEVALRRDGAGWARRG